MSDLLDNWVVILGLGIMAWIGVHGVFFAWAKLWEAIFETADKRAQRRRDE